MRRTSPIGVSVKQSASLFRMLMMMSMRKEQRWCHPCPFVFLELSLTTRSLVERWLLIEPSAIVCSSEDYFLFSTYVARFPRLVKISKHFGGTKFLLWQCQLLLRFEKKSQKYSETLPFWVLMDFMYTAALLQIELVLNTYHFSYQ